MKSDINVYICDHVEKVRLLHEDILSNSQDFSDTFEFINAMSINHYRQYAQGYPPSIIELRNWNLDCIGKDYKYIMALELSQEDIHHTQARQYGFSNWESVIEHNQPIDHKFEKAIDLLVEGSIIELENLLDRHPYLIKHRSPYGHKASLIHYIAANGIEHYRQIVPSNLVKCTQLLLDRGADVNAKHNIYGGDCTLIDLIQTSAHPNEVGVAQPLINLIKKCSA